MKLKVDEFAAHLVLALADYAAVRLVSNIPYRIHRDGKAGSALLIELDDGGTFHVEVTRG